MNYVRNSETLFTSGNLPQDPIPQSTWPLNISQEMNSLVDAATCCTYEGGQPVSSLYNNTLYKTVNEVARQLGSFLPRILL